MDAGMIWVFVPVTAIVVWGLVTIFRPLVASRSRQVSSAATPEIAARLERMEQALETIAVEVERISEGQRFTTRLLADRSTGDGHAQGSVVPPAEQRT